jgi:hypothetical protein
MVGVKVFNPSLIQQQVNTQNQKAGANLAAGMNSSTKAEDAGKTQTKKSAEELAAKDLAGKKTDEAKKQEEMKKKKEAEQKKTESKQLGSEAFMPTKEEEKQDPGMKEMEDFRKQASQFKSTGKFSGTKFSKTPTDFTSGSKFASKSKSAFGEHIKTAKDSLESDAKEKLAVHSDDGQLQLHTGLTTKEAKKDDKTKEAVIKAGEETQKKREIVTEKEGDKGQGGMGFDNKEMQDPGKLEQIGKIRKSTPAQDAAEAVDSLKDFQEKTGMSTKALKTAKGIAKTMVLDEADSTQKTKKTKMKPVKGTKAIQGNAPPAKDLKDISVKNEPLAMIPTNGSMNSETEMIKTKLPEKETHKASKKHVKGMLADQVTTSPKTGTKSDMAETREVTSSKTGEKNEVPPKTIYHLGTKEINQEFVDPKNVTIKGKMDFKNKYGLELEGNTKTFQGSNGTTVIDNMSFGKTASVPVANLFDGKEHKVVNVTPEGASIYISSKLDPKDPNHLTINGSGGPAGKEWTGDVYKSVVDGKETYEMSMKGQENEKGGHLEIANTITVDGNKESNKIRAFYMEPRKIEQPVDKTTSETAQKFEFSGTTNTTHAQAVPPEVQIRGVEEGELDRSSTVYVKTKTQDNVSGNINVTSEKSTFIDGLDSKEAAKKDPALLVFDGKPHTVVTTEVKGSPYGQTASDTVLKVVPDKDNPDKVGFTGRYTDVTNGNKTYNVQGEAIKVMGENGEAKVVYKFHLVDPVTNEIVFSGNGDQMPKGDGNYVNRGNFTLALPPQDQNTSQIQPSPYSWDSEPGDDRPEFMKKESTLMDFSSDSERKKKA